MGTSTGAATDLTKGNLRERAQEKTRGLTKGDPLERAITFSASLAFVNMRSKHSHGLYHDSKGKAIPHSQILPYDEFPYIQCPTANRRPTRRTTACRLFRAAVYTVVDRSHSVGPNNRAARRLSARVCDMSNKVAKIPRAPMRRLRPPGFSRAGGLYFSCITPLRGGDAYGAVAAAGVRARGRTVFFVYNAPAWRGVYGGCFRRGSVARADCIFRV